MLVRLIGESKLDLVGNGVEVDVRERVWLSRCVSPVIDWQPVQGTPHFALCQLRNVKAPTAQDDNQKKWMDG